jgi:TonB family protein
MSAKPATKVADYKLAYPFNIRWGTIGALLIALVLFLLIPQRFNIKPYQKSNVEKAIISEDIKLNVENLVAPPPEVKPAVPEEASSEEEVQAATMGQTEFAEIYSKPEEAVDIPIVPYYKVEKKPAPQYSPKPDYPPIAKQSGMEGQVIIEAIVYPDGSVGEVKVMKSSGYPELDRAAADAARKWKFSPGEQRGVPVKVPVSIPFNFSLTEG